MAYRFSAQKLVLLLFFTVATIGAANAQNYGDAPFARCIDMARGGIPYIVMNSGYSFQENLPMNAGVSVRDPSGQTFMRLPAQNPTTNAFFMAWNGQLIEINMWQPGAQVIGQCNFFGRLPAPPIQPTLPNFQMTTGAGVIAPNGQIFPIPQKIYEQQRGISPPASAKTADAQRCLDLSGGSKTEFMDCLAPRMMTADQTKAYACMRQSEDKLSLSTCLAKTMIGENERRALSQAEGCYRENGTDWEKYSLCMAEKNFDPKIVASVNCLRKQAQTGSSSAWQVAGCVAGNALGLNPELTVAVECAMTSGGEPMTFAGCTGGRLTTMELNKCFTIGVGGNGCFGDNNEIVKGLRAVGVDLQRIMGPNGFAVQNWNNAINDIQRGPGPNNEVNKAIRTINNDLKNGMGENNDIRKALKNFGLGGLF